MMNPYVLLGALVGAILLAVTSFGAGWKMSSNSWKADLLAAEQEHAQQMKAEIDRTNGIAAELETEKGKSRVVYKTITKRVEKVVERPVYRAECIDDDGLSLINSALLGQAPSEPKPADGVPAPRPLRR